MEVIVERAGALDIQKKTVVACVRTPGPDGGHRPRTHTPVRVPGGRPIRLDADLINRNRCPRFFPFVTVWPLTGEQPLQKTPDIIE
jgi:hypothetical protein